MAPEVPRRHATKEARVKGLTTFSADDADRIRDLLARKCRTKNRDDQKALRDTIRGLGFYISEFRSSTKAFAPEDFDHLIAEGRIVIR
jgi:hypothetical protein